MIWFHRHSDKNSLDVNTQKLSYTRRHEFNHERLAEFLLFPIGSRNFKTYSNVLDFHRKKNKLPI